MSGAMLFGNINSEIKRNKVEALCPALSNFTFLHRLEGRTWFRKKKSKISCWSISKVGSPPRSSCRSRARRIFSPWSKCQLKPDFWGRGDPLLALCNADQLNLASFVHLLTVSGQFILCNIDLICEGCCDKPIIFSLCPMALSQSCQYWCDLWRSRPHKSWSSATGSLNGTPRTAPGSSTT